MVVQRRGARWGSRRRVALVRGLWVTAELAVTLGVVVLLLVVHQLWWTNQQAKADAKRQVQALEQEWGGEDEGDGEGEGEGTGESGGGGLEVPEVPDGSEAAQESAAPPRGSSSGRTTPRWDQAYAVLRIPRIGVVAPVAQGIAKRGVLDKGYVGHYPRTAQPGQAGNFAVAGHRNTHGEPFRYINRLRRGDKIVVETREAVFTYLVDRALPQTSARDGGVIAAVPRSAVKPGYGYSEPGYYLTLTTCTPEYTSKYRLVVWGKLASMRPR
ncbi:class E sortase [Streptomyces sp. NPDC007861]|uniref:class E sortase n=1 Tax=Streptomyces sp. NPDC007861 TaxID=3154893 RepID=UPI0034097255